DGPVWGPHHAFPWSPRGARAYDKIEFVHQDRLHQPRDRLRPIAAVAIEKDEDPCAVTNRRGSPPVACSSVSAFSLDKYRGAAGTGQRYRPVTAAAVDDDDFVD